MFVLQGTATSVATIHLGSGPGGTCSSVYSCWTSCKLIFSPPLAFAPPRALLAESSPSACSGGWQFWMNAESMKKKKKTQLLLASTFHSWPRVVLPPVGLNIVLLLPAAPCTLIRAFTLTMSVSHCFTVFVLLHSMAPKISKMYSSRFLP